MSRDFYILTDYMCQSPSRRGTHFYAADTSSGQQAAGVNPLHVGELISTGHKASSLYLFVCVNPLHVGELISTRGGKT